MSNKKILVSMIAYREKYLEEAVKSCYETAKDPENLLFSIISEQSDEALHADLSFIPSNQIKYLKYDLSTYRGVLWSRVKTVEIYNTSEYDYVLFTCGHNRFVPNWDQRSLDLITKLKEKTQKPLVTIAGPSFKPNSDGSLGAFDLKNDYRPKISSEYIPGYGFPEQVEVPDSVEYLEDTYLQFSWVFAEKTLVEEVPLDPDMNYHGEEIYTTIQAWCRGWRFYTTSEIFYYHDTEKQYEGESLPRMTTHRPWSDLNKDYFWKQSDESMLKLNKLLSGNLVGVYGDITKTSVLGYCKFSGLNTKWCEYDPNYDKLTAERHGEFFRDRAPYLLETS